jgi:cytochrome c-type biogenesis protein CcmH/NrfG
VRISLERRVSCILAIVWFAVMVSLQLAADSIQPAQHLLEQGRVDDAVAMLTSEVQARPDDAEAYNLLCRAYLTEEKSELAMKACEQAVKTEPNNSNYHLWLGRSYGQQAEQASTLSAARLAGKVRDELETAVRLNPRSVDARADLADFYLEAPRILGGGEQKAEDQARELAKLEPAQGDFAQARIAEKNKNFLAAEADYHNAIRESGGTAGSWLALARFYRARSRFDEMEQAIAHATAPEMNRPDLLMSAAEMLIQSGHDIARAQRLLERYISSSLPAEDAPVFKAHYSLGKILEQQGMRTQAINQYETALTFAKDFAPARSALERLETGTATRELQ